MSLQLRGDLQSPRAAPERKRMKVRCVGISAGRRAAASVRVGEEAVMFQTVPSFPVADETASWERRGSLSILLRIR